MFGWTFFFEKKHREPQKLDFARFGKPLAPKSFLISFAQVAIHARPSLCSEILQSLRPTTLVVILERSEESWAQLLRG